MRLIISLLTLIVACGFFFGCVSLGGDEQNGSHGVDAATVGDREMPAAAAATAPATVEPKDTPPAVVKVFTDVREALTRGQYEEAERLARRQWLEQEKARVVPIDEALQIPQNRELALYLAEALLGRGPNPTALDILERLIQMNRDWEPPYVALAEYYQKHRAWKLVLNVIEAGLSGLTEPGQRVYALGAVGLVGLGERDRAGRMVSRGLDEYSESGELLWLKGLVEELAGEREEACTLFREAFRYAPEHAEVAHNHSVCLARAKKWAEAQAVIGRAVYQNPQHPRLRLLQGEIARQMGDLLSARRSWHDYLALTVPNDPVRPVVEAALAGLGRDGSDATSVH